MKLAPRPLGLVALGLAATMLSAHANAAFLYWSKIPVKTGTESKCMQLANGVASQNMQGVRRSNLEIAGTRNGVYVAITCVGRGNGQNAMGVIMAMGDNGPATSGARDFIADKLSKTQFID